MTGSPTSRQRSHLLREMSRDLAGLKKRAPSISDHGSVSSSAFSDFDPENEALMSTRQMESSRIPETAKPSTRRNGFDSDIVINTAAFSKAFPDNTGSDFTESIEIGRGILKKGQTNFDAPYDDSILTPNPMIGNFEVTGTPPTRSMSFNFRHDRKATTDSAKAARAVSHHEQQRKASEDAAARKAKKSLPTRFTSREALHKQAAGHGERTHTNAFSTQPSFILPDLPNISELVSGVFEDGTPVFTRTRKGTRFTSSGRHVPISSIPVPEEERAILISLRVLQDKVADLELSKTQSEQRMQELQNDNSRLRAENDQLQRNHRPDSALGMADSDDDRRQKKESEAMVKSLQSRLDSKQNDLAAAEVAVKSLTQERDNAVSQLGVAYVTTEELKTENARLRKELASLKKHLVKSLAEREDDTKKWAATESKLRSRLETVDSKAERPKSRQAGAKTASHRSIQASIANQVKREVSRLNKGKTAVYSEAESEVDSADEQADLSNIRRHLDNDATTRSRVSLQSRKSTAESVRRKPSLKKINIESWDEHTGQLSLRIGQPAETKQSTLHSIRTSQSTRPKGLPEMTSAFIIPDITLSMQEAVPVLSNEAKQVLNGLTKHESKNCSVCRRLTCSDPAKCHITIPKPVPVTDRMPAPGEWTEEPTSRPAQPPAVAIATVLKELEDEYAHMKIDLARLQALYNAQDASISKRRRKALFKRIERLVKAIDSKADQIYALYDVVEGQKQRGQQMDDDELQITLSTIGIDLKKMGGSAYAAHVSDEEDEAGSSDNEEELPWEGIDDLTSQSMKSRASRRKTWEY